MNKEEIQETEKKPKEYAAFGVTGGIGAMIGVAIAIIIGKPQFWRALHDFIEYIRNHFGC